MAKEIDAVKPLITTASGPTTPPLLVSHKQAAALCGVSAASWHRLLSAGKIGPLPRKLGARVLFSASELTDWVRAGCPGRDEWIARLTTQRE